jgi:hypothetical protein
MKSAEPPRLATYLLTRLGPPGARESLLGDLHERYQRAPSPAWYWRKTVSAIAAGFAAEIWQHKWLAAFVAALSAWLPDLWMFSRLGIWADRVDKLWYSRLIHSRWSWMVIDPWAYRLKPYLWTSNLVWCALLAALSWAVCHWRPRQRGLVIALVLVPQLAARIPFVWADLGDWLKAPGDPIPFYSLVWYASITFLAIPFSVVLGGTAGAREGSARPSLK